MDLSRVTEVTKEIDQAVEDLFTYKEWNAEQQRQGTAVRTILAQAYKSILAHVPPCLDRTVALRNITDARLHANSAITFGGS